MAYLLWSALSHLKEFFGYVSAYCDSRYEDALQIKI